MLCKHEVTGSIPVSSTKTYSLFPDRRHKNNMNYVVGMNDADPETGRASSSELAFGRFLAASGRAVTKEKDATVWMFDNEIDWVTRLERHLTAVRRMEWQKLQTRLNTRPSTCELVEMTDSGKCSSKKSVFRRCNLVVRERE